MRTGAEIRPRLAVAAGLTFTVVAGLWLTNQLGGLLMTEGSPMKMPDGMVMDSGGEPAGLPRLVILFLMWWSMMMAMMLPSAAPAIVSYGTIARKLEPPDHTPTFVLGYAALWTAFAGFATALQLLTANLVPLNGMMAVVSTSIGGGLLIVAGLYQISSVKRACLAKCQSPFFYLAHHWRPGPKGAFSMGLSHGVYCVGCCWMLMLLLFYGGVMDPRWIVGLALYVAAEKLAPVRYRLSWLAAAALVIWGIGVLVSRW